MEYTLTDIREQVMTARGSHKRLLIAGGGSKSFYGNLTEPQDSRPFGRLDMTAHRGVIDYQPSELVVTVRTGTPLAELEAVLAGEGQMLAFEPPHFGAAATVGGCIASGLAGPRRVAAGGVRDFVLGVRLLDAEGRILRFGGEVMKNVAGYDISRLMAGSLGIFGVMLDVSLKVVPQPRCERTLRFSASEAQALAMFARWRAQPRPVSAAAWLPAETDDGAQPGAVWLRLSGSEAAVLAACADMTADLKADLETIAPEVASAHWLSLREQTHPFFQTKPVWRLAVPPTTPPLGLGKTLLEWGGGQRWLAGAGMTAQHARQAASAAGGHATLFCRDPHTAPPADGVFHPLAAGPATITRNLKHEFDPTGLFNPGRLIPDL